MAERLLPFMSKTQTGVYRYRRQVPQALRETLGCWEIKRSLGRDYFEAVQTYKAVHAETEKALTSGAQVPASDREVVIRLIQRSGISAGDLASLINGTASEELKDHLSNILDAGALEDEYREAERAGKEARVSLEAIRAINAGRVPDQVHTLETALKFYIDGRKGDDETLNKSEENRAENLKRRVIAAIGKDRVTKRPLERLTREDARAIRDHMLAELHPNSVRRMLGTLRAAVNKTILEHDLSAKNPLEKLEIKGAGNSREDRLPLSEEDMKALASVMVKGDDDVLGIIWVALRDTGARLSEIVRRKVSEVRFAIPAEGVAPSEEPKGSVFIPIGKAKNSVREVPLSPAALKGLKALAKDKAPDDLLFPTYGEGRGPDSASQALMKRLRTVIKDEKKAVYSLRHRLKDRLRDTGCPGDIQEEIMGHDTQNIARNYGAGYSLEKKREYLKRVWDSTPA